MNDRSCEKISNIRYEVVVRKESGMFLNGAIHWIAKSKNKYRETLISFSIKEKVFREFSSPMDEYDFMTVGVLGGELCVLCKTYGIDLDIWVMKNYGLSDSWVKPFAMERTIKMSVSDSCSSHLLYNKRNPRPLCFAKSGEVLLRDGNEGAKGVVLQCEDAWVS